ncbi:MAG TPA: DHCW motif cupin fold protein [Acidobacteriaceae bacterium]|nr:DHCW motif cupin fold protein [Acidobacteriaceae bacterium]
MKIENIPFTNIDWTTLPATESRGESGTATSKEMTLGNIRLRRIRFSPNYTADHWCTKGHIVTVLEGSLTATLQTGETHITTAGNTFVVSDNLAPHRAQTTTGAKVLIID